MKNFFKNILTSAIGSFVGIGILVLFIIMVVAVAISGEDDKITKVDDNSVLQITFSAPIMERGSESETPINFADFGEEVGLGLNHIVEDIAKAKGDNRIQGIFIDMSGLSASPSTAFDIREAISDFKESGKWVVAYNESFSQGQYYFASVADEVYLYPEGGIEFMGLSAELTFFKNMLDKLEIDIQVLRGPNNKYKSAAEPLMYDKMSEPNREQYEALLGDIWGIMLQQISESRGISVDKLNQIADSLDIRTTADALENGLVDGLKYRDEVMAILEGKLGIEQIHSESSDDDEEKNDNEINFVSLKDYHNAKVGDSPKGNWKKDQVAVIYAIGGIESGDGDDQTIGSTRIAGALKEARESDKVKAIVLRVNSPGGSALASDVIWRETQLIKESGKPFIVSMGDVAASGGYYIACSADKIYANENTITGSIGVFGLLPNMQGMFNNKLGVTFDRVNTNAHSDMMTVAKPLDELQREAIEESVHDIYDQFTGLVAEGRGMTQAEVDAVGQGRVWSGQDAKEIGLVDEIGDLNDAVLAAAAMAELEDYRIKDLPEMIDPFEEMMKELTGDAEANIIAKNLGENVKVYEQFQEMQRVVNSGKIQARLPYFLEIK